jgi:hypothetical protein
MNKATCHSRWSYSALHFFYFPDKKGLPLKQMCPSKLSITAIICHLSFIINVDPANDVHAICHQKEIVNNTIYSYYVIFWHCSNSVRAISNHNKFHELCTSVKKYMSVIHMWTNTSIWNHGFATFVTWFNIKETLNYIHTTCLCVS